MTTVAVDTEFQSRMRQLNEMLEQVRNFSDPAARDTASRIVQTMMEFHGAGLGTILERLADAGDMGRALINELAQDELVSSMLLLYGLHPLDLESRVRLALESVRPYLASHGGNVELLRISEEGAVHLKMQGSCHGCPSSAITLKTSIEQAIYDKAPDVAAIHVAGIEEPAKQPESHVVNGFVPVEQLLAGLSARNGKSSKKG